MDEVQVRAAAIEARVDMREADIDQAVRLVDTRGRNDGFHGELQGLAVPAV